MKIQKPFSLALSLLAATVLCAGISWAADMADMPVMPKPTMEHQWLQQFVGNWESETQATMTPGEAPVVSKGTEEVEPLGAFWTITEVKSTMMDKPFTGTMTLGYDTDKQKFIGTWVDSMTGKLWEYEGNVDAAGKKLTLETEGACPMHPGKVTRFKEEIELKSPDHKVFTSSMLDDNGQWVTMMVSNAYRKDNETEEDTEE